MQGNPIGFVDLYNKVEGVQVGFGHHGGDCSQGQVDIIKTISDNDPLLGQVGKLGGGTAVTDDQIVDVQLAQLDQVADIDDLDEVVQVDLVGADVVVEIALLEQGRIFQIADIQLDVGDVTQVAVVDIAPLDQIFQVDLVKIQGDQTVQRNGGGIIDVVNVYPELGFQSGDVEVVVIEIMDVDETGGDVVLKSDVIQYGGEQGIQPHCTHVHHIVKLAVLE